MIILQKPHLTPKSATLSKKNKYCFIVHKKANKPEIKKTIKKRYNVDVAHITTMIYPKRAISRYTKKGVVKGSKPSYKKAILTLAPGHTIDMYANTL